ncbi:Lactate-binding periplasmic protein [subsurface metagenome]
MQEAYNEQNVHWIGFTGFSTREVLSNKPLYSLADFKGLKIRATGLEAKLLEKMGAAPTFVDLGELYMALSLGTVDAQLFAWPRKILNMKLCEVSKYAISPTWTGCSSNFIAGLDAWNSLPEDLQKIVTLAYFESSCGHRRAAKENEDRQAEEIMARDYGYTKILLPQEDIDQIEAFAYEVWDEVAAKNDRCAKGIAMLKDLRDWNKIRYQGIYPYD